MFLTFEFIEYGSGASSYLVNSNLASAWKGWGVCY